MCLYPYPPYLLKQGLKLASHCLAAQAAQETSGILPAPLPTTENPSTYYHAWLFMWVLEIQTRSHCLHRS